RHTGAVDERDLSRLSERVRLGAIVEPNGEVKWPVELANTAINELADDGSVVLGLDLWPDEEEAPTEVPLSVYPGGATRADIEPARRHALEAVGRAPELGWSEPRILVTWARPP
ncbi:MAG: hypothetical protein M3Y66_05885, partial [Actinomycetota bacterium]|nr:hypothetical protein [Actinomycetota bacterium]